MTDNTDNSHTQATTKLTLPLEARTLDILGVMPGKIKDSPMCAIVTY